MDIDETILKNELFYLKQKRQELLSDITMIENTIKIYDEIRELEITEQIPDAVPDPKTGLKATKVTKMKPIDPLTGVEVDPIRRSTIYNNCKSKHDLIKIKHGDIQG